VSDKTTRRRFLAQSSKSALLGTGLLASASSTRTAKGILGANEKVRMGWIGCGGRGRGLLQEFRRQPDVQVIAACDVNRPRLEQFGKETGGKIDFYSDFRKLLERKDLDAVVVATNGHWHCLPTIHACQAGKDVYVEKPLAWSIGEGRMMVQAARKYDRIVMVGTQQRSMPHYQEAIDFIQSGQLGAISEVRSWTLENKAPTGYGAPPDCAPPEGLDWDFWLGPAPKVPFNPNRLRFHYWFWDYGGGWESEWAVHMNDITHWAMGVKAPLSAAAIGGNFACKDNRELPDTLEVTFEYPGFVYLYTCRQGNAQPQEDAWYGNAFYGEKGMLFINRQGWRVVPQPVRFSMYNPSKRSLEGRIAGFEKPGSPHTQGWEEPQHQRLFLDAVKAHKRPKTADVEIGHLSSVPGHLANIAYRTGRRIHWDAEQERIKGDPEANKLLTRHYRKPWMLEI